MDRLHIFIVIFIGADWISGSVVDVTVRSGENITLYCDCKTSAKEYILWYRNCTHEKQPPLVLKLKTKTAVRKPISDQAILVNSLPRFHFVENQSSGCYDLLIMNVSDSDDGLYYCGTEQKELVKNGTTTNIGYVYEYGSATRILISSSDRCSPTSTGHVTPQDSSMCWKLLFILCPTFAVLSSLIGALLVHHLCHKTVDQERPETSEQTRRAQDEDVCYAAVETRQATQRPKKKTTYSSDVCTYSAIKTSRV